MKNIVPFFILIMLFQSCQYFDKKVPEKEQLLEEELKKIDWEQVDELPTVLQCDTFTDKLLKKQCFFDFMEQTVEKKLLRNGVRNKYGTINKLSLKITILPTGGVIFKSQNIPNSKTIDSLLNLHLINFPPVEPAIKRGVKVKSQILITVHLKKHF